MTPAMREQAARRELRMMDPWCRARFRRARVFRRRPTRASAERLQATVAAVDHWP
jgi:hypothetical protein